MRCVLLLGCVLLVGPALAHHDERHAPANAFAQNTAVQADSIRELQRQRANPEVPPGVQAQRRDAADADAASLDDAAGQLRAALTALRAGRGGQANEFLERAESRLLTRSTLPARAGVAVQDGPTGRIAAARAALLRNDRIAAQREIEAALTVLDPPSPRAGRQPR